MNKPQCNKSKYRMNLMKMNSQFSSNDFNTTVGYIIVDFSERKKSLPQKSAENS